MRTSKEKLIVNVVANLVIVFAVALVLVGSLAGMGAINVSGSNKAIYQGNTAESRVTLMVNVYWGTEYIEDMLEVFDRYGAKTTFFFGGSWVAKNSGLLKKIYDKGHEIANHGYLHKDHKYLSYKQNEDEIMLTERLIESHIGQRTNLFAPPSGSLGAKMFDVCIDNGYKVIMWSKDTIDWRDKDENLVYRRATNDIQKGDLILMHPTAHTLKALPRILQYYKDNGINATTVTENLSPSLA